ncbi:MAG TPA: pilus assembly protein TadG-related protein [Geminicoccaceae bacterium]|nr:pilus assembly protein TadG-related protein [Geminicoccaceae bacterium]
MLAAIVGLAIIPLFAAIGLAVDTARGYMLKSKLSYAIDAAGLAGGRAFETDQREADIMMFFEANFPPGYMSSTLAPGDPDIVFDDENNTITITASATIPTRFMSVAGVKEMTVSARTVIKRELRGMELVLVMDNTGSMRSNGGMTAMKPAATDLVNILFGDRETVPNFWVGVVPYAANVNIGPQHEDWLVSQAFDEDAAWQNADPDSDIQFGYHPDHYLPTTWKGCVEAREYPRDSNDDPPGVEAWYPYLWRTTLRRFENSAWPYDDDDYVIVVHDNTKPYTNQSNVIYQQGGPSGTPTVIQYDATVPATWGRWLNGDNDWDPDGAESALKLDNEVYQNEGTGPNLGCGPAITPLVSSKSTVQAAIDEMAPWHRGGTMANLGLAWGWRVLSPRWRGLWDGDDPDELPLDYAQPNMEKVVILLTDGNNEWYDYPGITWNPAPNPPSQNHYSGIPGSNAYPSSSPNKNTWPGADYTAYGRLSEARLGTTNNGVAKSIIDDRMLDMCQTMKAQGIIIYTMTFGGSPSSSTQQMYRDCATKPDMYYHAPSGSALQQAFVTIADELSRLRIAE